MAASGAPVIPIPPEPLSSAVSDITLNFVFLTLSWACVLARFWTRFVILRNPGLDDLFIGLALVFYTIYDCFSIYINMKNKQVSLIPVAQLRLTINMFIIEEVFYPIAMVLIKISVGFFLLRIVIRPVHRRIVIVLIIFSAMAGMTYAFYGIFQCGNPIGGIPIWERLISNRCLGDSYVLGMGYSNAITNALTDFLFAAFPILIVRDSQMSFQEKAMISALLMIGAIDGVVSVVRIGWTHLLTDHSINAFNNLVKLNYITIIEPGLGIIAASLATLRPLLRIVAKKLPCGSNKSSGRSGRSPSAHLALQELQNPAAAHLRNGRPVRPRGESILDESLATGSTWTDALKSTDYSLAASSKHGYSGRFSPMPKFSSRPGETHPRAEPLLPRPDGEADEASLLRAESREGRRLAGARSPVRRHWWRPPTFDTGLMTEFNRGVDLVHAGPGRQAGAVNSRQSHRAASRTAMAPIADEENQIRPGPIAQTHIQPVAETHLRPMGADKRVAWPRDSEYVPSGYSPGESPSGFPRLDHG